MNSIFDTWEWYIAGPLLGLFVPLLLLLRNKLLGISSSFIQICAALLPNRRELFAGLTKEGDDWKIYFVIGILLGAYIAANFLSNTPGNFLPDFYFTTSGYIKLLIGGFFVGFGTRYANGCTSGHTITGLSLLQSSSLKASIAFFIGGLLFTYTIGNL